MLRNMYIVAFCLMSLWTAPAWSVLPVADGQGNVLPTLAPVLDKARPAVVNISTKGFVQQRENPLLRDPFFRFFFDMPENPRMRKTQSLGSGVIVDAAKGYILTNNHVIDKAAEITVTLTDGRNLVAKLIGTDPETDIAVIQVPAKNLVALPLANSDVLRVGDFVVAIGNPFGLGQTVTSGIISALGRSGLGIEGYEDFIQTDASINPGNSGGALINLRGELVGINTAIIAPGGGNVGIGFAIPVNMAGNIMDQLLSFGEVKRGQLGVIIQDLTPELAAAFNIKAHKGVLVADVVAGSAAEKAGLKAGDIITALNGRKTDNAAELHNRMGLLRVGEKVNIQVLRDGSRRQLSAKVDAPQLVQARGKKFSAKLVGAVFGEVDPASPFYGKIKGVVVTEVERGSAAWGAGLRKADLLVSVNRNKVTTLKEFEKEISRARQTLLLHIQRGDSAFFLLLR